MWLNDKAEEHLREMASFRSCQIIITDFNNVIFNTIERNKTNKQISRELLNIILDFSINAPNRQEIQTEDNLQKPIFEDDKTNLLSNCCQIIMPIYRLNTLSGLLIMFFSKQDRDYELQKSITIAKLFLKEVEQSINGFHIKDIAEVENISNLFNDEYLDHVAKLFETKKNRLQKNKQYKRKKKKLSQMIQKFEGTLSEEQLETFENILSSYYTLEDFEQALMYSIGVKYGVALSKL